MSCCRYCTYPGTPHIADHHEHDCPALLAQEAEEAHQRKARDLVEMLDELRRPPETSHRTRKIYVYALAVEYPKGSKRKGWAPEGWNEEYAFYWPRLRTYLSEGAANHQAKRLREYGAVVQVLRSRQVTWD